MKTSLFLTALILLGAAAWHFTTRRSLEALHQEARNLRQTVVSAGLDPVAAAKGQAVRPPEDAAENAAKSKQARETEARNFAQELITFALEMNSRKGQKESPDEATQQRIMAIMKRFTDLDADSLRTVIEELKTSPALEAKTKAEIMGMSVMMLAQSDPGSAMKLFIEGQDMLATNAGMAKYMAGMCLASWGEKDPKAMLAWMNQKENAAYLTNENRRMAFTGLARKDPTMALKTLLDSPASLISREDQLTTASMIASTTPAESRQALLEAANALKADPSLPAQEQAAAQKHASSVRKNILLGIGSSLVQGTPAESIGWLEKTNLTPEDRNLLLGSVAGSLHGQDPKPWLNWMGKSVTNPVELNDLTESIIPQWTRRDFNGAAEWIKSQPEGPQRATATKSFARTLAPHEPEAAAAWALTLPPAETRTNLLQEIVTKWSTKDRDAAAAFATQHQLKEPP